MARRAWLTPDTPPPEDNRGRCFSVPDDVALVAAVTGALLPLTQPENWEESGSMSAEDAADIMSAAFELFVESDCSTECPPLEIPDMETPIYRQNPTTGRWEYIAPDGWVEPTGDDAIPDPAAREEETEALQQCGAASNAANSLKELYAAILGVYDSEVDPLLNQIEIAAQIALAYGTTFGPISSTVLAYAGAIWETFTYLLDQVTEDDWDAAWMEELVCILNSNVTVTDGVAHFDYFNVNNDLVGFILPVIDDFVRVRWQTWYLLQCIGSQGLDLAGATTDVEADCATCDRWCVQFDPETLGLVPEFGYFDANGFLHAVWNTTYNDYRAQGNIVIDTTNCQIKRAQFNFNRTGGGAADGAYIQATPTNAPMNAYTAGNYSRVTITPNNDALYSTTDETTVFISTSGSEPHSQNIDYVTIWGTGINPFGLGSNC